MPCSGRKRNVEIVCGIVTQEAEHVRMTSADKQTTERRKEGRAASLCRLLCWLLESRKNHRRVCSRLDRQRYTELFLESREDLEDLEVLSAPSVSLFSQYYLLPVGHLVPVTQLMCTPWFQPLSMGYHISRAWINTDGYEERKKRIHRLFLVIHRGQFSRADHTWEPK